jgi:hypothetical protein
MAHQQVLSTRTLLRRALLITAICTLVVASVGRPAVAISAIVRGPQPPKPFPWGYAFGASQQGHPGNSRGGSGTSDVSNRDNGGNGAPLPPDMCGSFKFGIQACTLPQLPGNPAPAGPGVPAVSPAQLAIQAWQRLLLPRPEVATAPPRGSDGLVGLAQWFWVTNWSSHHDRVQAGGVWAEVTARPASLTINPGAGTSAVTCTGPGTAYDRKRGSAGQRSDCSYTYVRSSAGMPSSAYQVTATVTWGGTWVGSGGTGGTLPALSRSSSFALRVAEGQAVTK